MEATFGINSGMGFFRGADAASATVMYITDVPGLYPNYVADHYSRKPGLALGGELAVQRISRHCFIVGLAAGYESLKSKITITDIYGRGSIPATGTATATYSFFHFYPYLGQRLIARKWATDLNLGVEIAIPQSARQKATATSNDGANTVMVSTTLRKPPVDLRPRFQVKLQYNHIGLLLSCSYGTINAYGRLDGLDPEAYINIIRAGVFYKW